MKITKAKPNLDYTLQITSEDARTGAGICALVRPAAVKGFSCPALLVYAQDASKALAALNDFDARTSENYER